MRQTRFPPGWDEERVRRVLEHYETQTDEAAVAEDAEDFEAFRKRRGEESMDFEEFVKALKRRGKL